MAGEFALRGVLAVIWRSALREVIEVTPVADLNRLCPQSGRTHARSSTRSIPLVFSLAGPEVDGQQRTSWREAQQH
jgi:hypothetical protein